MMHQDLFWLSQKLRLRFNMLMGIALEKVASLMKNTVSDLFYGIPVNGVITLDIEGLSKSSMLLVESELSYQMTIA